MLLLLALLVLAAYVLCRRINKIRGLPPGPTPVPFIGNLLSLDGDTIDLFLEWKKKYGNVFTVWLPFPTVVINDAEIMRSTVIAHGDAFGGRQPIEQTMKILCGGNYGLVFNGNDMWKEQKRFAMHSMRDLGGGSPAMQDALNFLARRAVDVIKDLDGKPIDPTPHITGCVGNVVTHIVFNRMGDHIDEPTAFFKENLSELFHALGSPRFQVIEFIPALKHLDSLLGLGVAQVDKVNRCLLDYVDKEIEVRESQIEEDSMPKCFVDYFLLEIMRREKAGEDFGTFTRHQMRIATLDLCSAGMEAAVTALRLAIVCLLNNPAAQAKCHEEIDRVLGKREPRLADQKAMHFTSAVLQEVLRLAAIFLPMNFLRQLQEPAVVDGYHLPTGTAVVPQFQSVHFDPDVFPRPHLFWPERHLNDQGECIKNPIITPFSVGKRSCFGEGLGRAQMFIFLVTFLQYFRFESSGSLPPEFKLVPGFVRTPEYFECRLVYRHTD